MGRKRPVRHMTPLLLVLFTLFISSSLPASSRMNVDENGTAIKGYDPVAYFTVGKPVKGLAELSHEWSGAKWLFSSQEHQELFSKEPERYAPQYGGY